MHVTYYDRCLCVLYPYISQKRLQTQEETPRKEGDNTHQRQSHTWYRPVLLESLLGFGVSSGEFLDYIVAEVGPGRHTPRSLRPRPAAVVGLFAAYYHII